MNNMYFLLLSIESEAKSGGLFDFDGTLPLAAIQFLVLMFILQNVLYDPILNIIAERQLELKNQEKTTELKINAANAITSKYNEKIEDTQRIIKTVLKNVEINLNTNFDKNLTQFNKSSAKAIIETEKILETSLLNNDENTNQKVYSNFLATLIIAGILPSFTTTKAN